MSSSVFRFGLLLIALGRLVFAGKNRPAHINGGKGPHNGYAIRQVITEQLLLETASDIYLKITNSRGTNKEEIVEIHRALARSVFTITPPGDSPTRKSFFDALLLGSIPVIFRKGTYVFPHLHLEDLAIILPEQEIIDGVGRSLVERLRAVASEEIRRKQVEIAEIARMMQYSIPTMHGELEGMPVDAIAVILNDLVLLRDESLL